MRRLGIAASTRFLHANGIRCEHSSSLAAASMPRQPKQAPVAAAMQIAQAKHVTLSLTG
jgi:hypothetical protein